MQDLNQNKKSMNISYLYIFIAISFCLVNFFWFFKLGSNFHVLMGDDLNVWNYYKNNNSFWESTFLNTFSGKYRPIWNIVQFVLFKMFDNNFEYFFMLNIFINFVVVMTFWKIITIISTNDTLISLTVTTLFLLSRFSYYNVLQMTGLMEALCLLFFLITVFYSIIYYKHPRIENAFLIVFFFFLLIFTHERYMAIFPFISVLFFVKRINRKILSIIFIFSPLIFVVLNYVSKVYLLKSDFLVGTGGSATIGFNGLSFILSIINLFGINFGPGYLHGAPFHEASTSIKLSNLVLALVTLFIFLVYFHLVKKLELKQKKNGIILFLFTSALVFFILIPPCLTIRIELRWLYSAYVIFLMYIAHMVSTFGKKIKYVTILLLLLLSGFNDLYYRSHVDNFFFMKAQKVAESVNRNLVVEYGKSTNDKRIVFLKNQELDWPLLGTTFFKQFKVLNNTGNFVYVENVDYNNNETDTLYFAYNANKGEIENITNLMNYKRKKEDLLKKVSFNLLKQFNQAEIISNKNSFDTPSKKGVSIMDWDVGESTEETLTIVSGSEILYKDLSILQNSTLHFSIFNPLNAGDGSRFYVCIVNGSEKERIFEKEVPSNLKANDSTFTDIQLNLNEAGKYSLLFGVESPTNDDTADWVTVRDLLLIN